MFLERKGPSEPMFAMTMRSILPKDNAKTI